MANDRREVVQGPGSVLWEITLHKSSLRPVVVVAVHEMRDRGDGLVDWAPFSDWSAEVHRAECARFTASKAAKLWEVWRPVALREIAKRRAVLEAQASAPAFDPTGGFAAMDSAAFGDGEE